ncbi:MAG: aspartate/glutamate racemase family protein [Campylobacteraceae bacterium]
MLGGMSFESTKDYYEGINLHVKSVLGGLHSAKILLYSFDFHEIELLQAKDDWDSLAKMLGFAGENLKKAGADFLAICTNTMHIVAPEVENISKLKVLNLIDAVGLEIQKSGYKKVALLGTNYTMSKDFYKGKIAKDFGVSVLTPDENDKKIIHDIIYDELCLGKIKNSSRNEYIKIINKLKNAGTEAIILGCTEIPLLLKEKDSPLPLLNSTEIHIKSIGEYMLNV